MNTTDTKGAQDMKLKTDTRFDANHGDANFTATGKRIAWKYGGRIEWSQLYDAAADAIRWDGAPVDSQAVGSRFGCFGYVTVKITGRKLVTVPQTCGDVEGMKAKVSFDVGTEDECTLDAWIVKS